MRVAGVGTNNARVGTWLMTLLMATMLMGASVAQAAPIPFKRAEVSFNPQGQPLTEFLTEFFNDQGLSVITSAQVRARAATVSGPRGGSPAKVFASICAANDLISYYDGSAVYVYLSQERTTRYANLPPARVEDFVGAFQKMKLGDDSNTFTATSGNGLVMITGAPRFVEQVQQLADAINGQSPSNATVFKYYKLRYAWAADMTMTVGNRQQVIPGVASLLRELVSPTAQSAFVAQDRLMRPSANKLRGTGLASVGKPPLTPPGAEGDVRQDEGDIPPSPQHFSTAAADATPNARIVADTFRNAVIVRDAPDRIGMYDRLVQALDVEPQMVEIEATIIDINKGKAKKYGIDWRWQNARTAVNFGRSGVDPRGRTLADALGANNISLLNQLDGFQIGAIVGDAGKFIARINALATDDITNIVARPQVMTLNDTEAVIENSQTVYVPVAGAYDVDLFNVVAGTVLRVTPHLVYENGRRRIRTIVQIEDGSVNVNQTNLAGQVVNVPLVARKAVNTQALIDEGQSLLLGGLITDQNEKHDGKIPLLGDIPLLGNLFRQVEKDRQRFERLFLITPRLVAANRITDQQVPSSPDVSVEQIRADQDARDHAELPWASKEEKARYGLPVESSYHAPAQPVAEPVPSAVPTQPATVQPNAGGTP